MLEKNATSLFSDEDGLFLREGLLEELQRVSRVLKYFGFIALFLGMVIPFLIVIRVIEATLFLVFFSHTISVVGVLSGMLGIMGWGDDFVRPR